MSITRSKQNQPEEIELKPIKHFSFPSFNFSALNLTKIIQESLNRTLKETYNIHDAYLAEFIKKPETNLIQQSLFKHFDSKLESKIKIKLEEEKYNPSENGFVFRK